MKLHIKKAIFKTLKYISITFAGLLLIMFLVPYLFPGVVNSKINEWANKNINGNITFSGTSLSFFKHFPALTLTMMDVTLKGCAPFEKDTLIAAKEISLGIDISSVFQRKITINKVFLNDAFINIQVDNAGNANYNIYKASAKTDSTKVDTASASLGINQIIIKNSRLIYNDRSLPMLMKASGLNYSGSGDLSKDVFELNTHMQVQSFDFSFNKQQYILGKKINADLVTEINTKSLTLIFQKNDLNINQLPVAFNGQFGFVKDGYVMDLHINSNEKDLDEIVSAMPAVYQKLLDKTKISGTGNIQISLKGKFIAKDNIKPDLEMNLKVRDGYISNQKSPVSVQHIYLDLQSKFPGLNPDSAYLAIDSLHFKVGDGYFNSVIRIKGTNAPNIYARINSEIDLEQWDKATWEKSFQLKGLYTIHLLADGKYERKMVPIAGLRKKFDTVITSVPKFTLTSTFRHGYFKYDSVPQAITGINFNLRAACSDDNYKHISIAVDSIDITALDNYIKGYFRLGNTDNFPIDAALTAQFHLDDLKKFFPLDNIETRGDLNIVVSAKGNYQPDQKIFPVASANITLQNGSVKTKYYPHPVENIQVNTNISDSTGDLKGLHVSIKPVTFTFEDEDFAVKADLRDFTNLQYKVNLQGVLNIGNIYKVFAQKGYNVSGTIAANVSLKGRQSDAQAGNYDKLSNHGKLRIQDLIFTTELYPKPFNISQGVFRFNQEKMELDSFTVTYGQSDFTLDGAVTNVLDYMTKPGTVLQGNMDLQSNLIVTDELMAFADTSHPVVAQNTQTASISQTPGVIMVPKNMDLDFTAEVGTIKYSDIVITNAKGHLILRNDSLLLQQTGFNLLGSPVTMDASYGCISPQKAAFNYHILATDLDIKKAYNNIKLFHDLVSMAEHADGLISLDYQLSGILNSSMMPVYQSLKGGGVISAKKIRMAGFKLMDAIGKESKQDSVHGNSDVSKVAIKSSIANNIINIEPTKIRLAGFRAKFEGQVSFDKQLNLKFRLGLPPMGLIGIPMSITGTGDIPKIQVGKNDKDSSLVEVEDKEDN